MKIRKSIKWVRENDKNLVEFLTYDKGIDVDSLNYIEYYLEDNRVYYLPNGNEPVVPMVDDFCNLEDSYIEKLKKEGE